MTTDIENMKVEDILEHLKMRLIVSEIMSESEKSTPGAIMDLKGNKAFCERRDDVVSSVHLDDNLSIKGCKAFTKALNTLFALREQPGSEYIEDKKRQWTIDRFNATTSRVSVCDSAGVKTGRAFSCAFITQQAAQDAIKAVGEERILHAIKTLAGVKTWEG